MKRVPVLCGLFGVAFVSFAIATIPMPFVLERSGLERTGLQWQSASGTLWNGQISGVSFEKQVIGDFALTARPISFLKGQISYAFDWEGSIGNGTGAFSLNRSYHNITDLNVEIQTPGLVYVVDDIRRTNSSVRLRNGDITFQGGACADASGEASSDMLTKLAGQYDISATELRGNLSCNANALILAVEGIVADKDRVLGEVQYNLQGRSSLRVDLQTDDAVLGVGLINYGFRENDTGFVFQRELALLERY